jgi:DNA-binding response OmpR family regulator
MKESTTILVVDDEPAIVDVLTYNLAKSHYRVLVARTGTEALQKAREADPDLIILDLMLPEMDGFEVCKQLRKEGDVPIIMLTARDEEVDRVVGLEIGADDYVVKPFSVRELLARVKTVLRRVQTTGPSSDQQAMGPLTMGPLSLDPSRHEVQWHEAPFTLSPLEFELLHTFLRHGGQVLSREQLLDLVWGYAFAGDLRVVDTAMKRLRGKLRAIDPDLADVLVTVRGVGYKLVD